ncbi:hypothetical protein F441_02076 [Phytophthora nicotianae CJ01A1]|uniref:Uncharacterized protein n=5 Tax=Phytophthora nicotianae TaxID=4792 RepID=V9FUP8_PHYNI|nr:hypothetical protein F443_02098 [Phytophthora nicotianae P1569]ETK95049.1 hypothetical protein L915_02012 [Phytophthora nicotianae]ETO83956.1 hypothetical protein F444_02111 [Phytophthora nicotianae P1976]ETP25027.1 hypothetical protein F441_02076 [Phytophthora nicotianae CJ01A1]ETP53015.1 hypothetical protein F442_02051 [Phytophthora nicotianae P10297]
MAKKEGLVQEGSCALLAACSTLSRCLLFVSAGGAEPERGFESHKL